LLCCVIVWASAGLACAGHDGQQLLQLTEHGVESQAGASLWVEAQQGAEGLGEDGEGDVAMQPTKLRPSKWADTESGF
jgi:hypothetical protein